MKSSFFSYKDRIGRKKYLLLSLTIIVLGFALLMGLAIGGSYILKHFFQIPISDQNQIVPIFLILPGAILLWTIYSFPAVKRLHDIGFSGWFFLLMLLQPAYTLFRKIYLNDVRFIDIELLLSGISLVVIFVLLFKRGTMGSNKYGPDPLKAVN